MLSFFRGWRRKLGVVTLLMACAFAGGWVRSTRFYDDVSFQRGSRTTDLISCRDGVIWLRTCEVRARIAAGRWRWVSEPDEGTELPFDVSTDLADVGWHSQWYSFHVAETQVDPQSGYQFSVCVVPYWSIVMPLTLLAAGLLLSKPRPKKELEKPEVIQQAP